MVQKNDFMNFCHLRPSLTKQTIYKMQHELKTKASSHEGQCTPAGYCHTNAHYAGGVTISTVTIRSIWHNSAADFLRFWKFPPQISESCGATYRRNYETFSALLSRSGPLTNSENSVQIDWRRYPSSNWYEIDQKNADLNLALCCGAIWRHRENRNIGAQLQSFPYTTAQKDFGKFASCRTYSAHKLVYSEPFLDYRYEFWHLLSAPR